MVLKVSGVSGSGQGVLTDILEAAARAYVRALSNALRRRDVMAEAEEAMLTRPRATGADAVTNASPAGSRPRGPGRLGARSMKLVPIVAVGVRRQTPHRRAAAAEHQRLNRDRRARRGANHCEHS